jgi:hypothetical protein
MSVANFTTIVELKITHGRDGTEWFIVNPTNTNQSYGYFESLFIEEGMLNVIPSGTLVLNDVGDILSDFNFTGKDKFYLKIKDSDGNEIELKDYYVYQYGRLTDYNDKTSPRLLSIKFIHESYYFNERSVFEFEEDIKPICKTDNEDNWVDRIFSQYFSSDWNAGKAYASDTKNYAWLKHKNLAFPNGRKTDQTKILTLLNYLAENANADSDPPRADFVFWKDLSGVNFLSIGDELDASPEPQGKYGVFERDSIAPDGVVKIDDINIFNFSSMDLETNGVFQSYYERVDPNLDQPHFYLMDSSNSLKTKIINYNILDYYDEFPYVDKVPSEKEPKGGSEPPETPGGVAWNSDSDVANYEIINFGGQQIDISSLQGATSTKYTKRVYDEEKFGYFDYGSNNSSIIESPYYYNTEGGITNTNFFSNRRSSVLWQTMFDIDEESPLDPDNPATNIGKLYIQLKKQKKDAANVFFKLRNLKEQWNIFKYVICCLRQDSTFDFWAIVRPKSIAASKTGINTYSFKEVYFIPKSGLPSNDKINFLNGLTLEAKGITSLKSPLDNIPTSGFTFMEAINNIGTNRTAFNINEIRNFSGTIGYPNVNFAYAGPGTNMSTTGYPSAFKNMPIGSALGNDPANPPTAGIYEIGQIVKMTAIDWKTIRGISIDETYYQNNRYLFVFDSQNDKEGFCDGSNITIQGV